MKEMVYIPDIFVIGAMKAGTSTVWKNIKGQQANLETTRDKEVDYFIGNYTIKTINKLYSKQFSKKDTFKIDFSPNYSRAEVFEGIAGKIYRANPDAKIIYIVREPIARIISHLRHDMFRDRIPTGNYEAHIFDEGSDYITTSRYYSQISQYLKYFNKDQILVIPFEQLIGDKTMFYQQLSNFIGCDFIFPHIKGYNVSTKRYLIKYYDQFYASVKAPAIRKFYNYFWYMLNIKVDKPVLSERIRHRIKKSLEADANKLSKTFDIDITSWF